MISGRETTMRVEANDGAIMSRLALARERLLHWLIDQACPLWSKRGVDRRGGFVECLAPDGRPLAVDRRARVPPRQMFSFALARELGWQGEVTALLLNGYREFREHFRGAKGLCCTRISADGTRRDERTLLYDQAFSLLGLAAATQAIPANEQLRRHAIDLRDAIAGAYRMPSGAWRSGEPTHDLYDANSHMHLFEACLAWAEIDTDETWQKWADEIAGLALERFIRRDSGALTEGFAADWTPAPDHSGRRVEPGHQFEWAWLLLLWSGHRDSRSRQAALRLIDVGEHYGVRAGFAINAVLDDFTTYDANARLWPQTERLKATLLAAEITGEPRYLTMAISAAGTLVSYLNTRVAGLWFDQRLADGQWPVEPSPASSLYHIVGAIHALARVEKVLT